MEVRDDAPDLTAKVRYTAGSLLATEQGWATVDEPYKAADLLSEAEERHREKLEELSEFDRERWSEVIRRLVVEKEYGRKRTFDSIEEYFVLDDDEREEIEMMVEVYRKVRLEGLEEEDARRVVAHEMDPDQKFLDEVV